MVPVIYKAFTFLIIFMISQASIWGQVKDIDFAKKRNVTFSKKYEAKRSNILKGKKKPTLRVVNKYQYRKDLHKKKNIPIKSLSSKERKG